MVVYTKILINGSEVDDSNTTKVTKSISDNNSSSTFDINFDNYHGYNATKYEEGDEVKIYADSSSITGSPYNGLIFTGILEDIEYEGEADVESLQLSGRDYTARLMDRTVEPEVYNNLQPGSIVKDIIYKYTEDITTSGVQIFGTPISRIAFNQIPVYDAIKKLADLSESRFYITVNKDLIFEPKTSTTSSGYTFDNTNIREADFTERRDTIYNQVWVYGDRYLDGYKETLTFGSPVGGSSLQLLYKPSNTDVQVNGTVIQPGGILNMGAGSNVKYLVSYDDRLIIFTSGTTLGNNIPASGATVLVNYKRTLPIVKVGDDETSKAAYGTRVKVITDKDIKDPTTAELIMNKTLDESAEPKKEGNLKIIGAFNVEPATNCIVNMPYHDVNNATYDIIEVEYNLTKRNCLTDDVLAIKLNRKLPTLTDTLKDILLRQKRLEAGDISDTDLLTRYQRATGSLSVKSVYERVTLNSIGGNNLIWGNPIYGIWNTFNWNNTYDVSFILGNPIAGILGTSALGANPGSLLSIEYYVNYHGDFAESFTGSSFISGLNGCALNGGSLVF